MPVTKDLSIFQILEKLQLSEGKKLKLAAIVLFGKNPGQFYPNMEVRIGRFGQDSTDLRFQEVVEGNLFKMLEEVQTQLNNKFLVRSVEFVGMQRIEKDSYPIAAFREMLLNALVHRTYMGAHIQLRVFDDRLSIWNEGILTLGLTLEDLKKEHNSRPRNPKIAKACFMAGYIDTWGRGTLKIIQSCKEAGMPEPMISEKNGGIEVSILASHNVGSEGGPISGPISGPIGGPIVNKDGVMENLTERQKEVLSIISANSKISKRKLAVQLDINVSAAQDHLDILKEKGVLERIGGTRGFWVVKNSNS